MEKAVIAIPLDRWGGKLRDDTELRFALRSLDQHFKADEVEIAIIGKKVPKWIKGVKHIPGKGLKSSLVKASERYPSGFFWFYDDLVLLQDTTPGEMMKTPAKKICSTSSIIAAAKTNTAVKDCRGCPGCGEHATSWARSLQTILLRLAKEDLPIWDYSRPHGPYWFDKSMVDEGFVDWPGMAAKFPWETWILSKRDHPRSIGVTKQIYGEFSEPPADKRYLNYNDNGNTEELRNWLASRFPDPSRWEIGPGAGYTERNKLFANQVIRIEPSKNNERKAISFSLYGMDAKYSAGMVKNVELAAQLYPGWDVVIHAERGHYSIQRLAELGAIVIERPKSPGHAGASWRFETADMVANYDHVIFRDADSRLNVREKAAVDEWLASGKPLHVMRDHPKHTNPILAGMFGIDTREIKLTEKLKDWRNNLKYGQDEKFLADAIWPLWENSAIVHTSQTSKDGELPFPDHKELPEDVGGHVGGYGKLTFPKDSVRLVYLSPERYRNRRVKFEESLADNGGFLNDFELEWWKATPYDQCLAPPSFTKIMNVKHWWAATCDHLRIMEETLVGGYQHLFLFEDDVMFETDFHEKFWRAWASLPKGWRALRMGWNAKWANNPPVHENVLSRCDTQGHLMSAMFWNRDGLMRAYDHFWHRRSMSIDGAFEDLRKKEPNDWYQPAKMICPIDPTAKQYNADD